MDVGTGLLLMILALGLLGGAKAWRIRGEWATFQAWKAAGMPTAPTSEQPPMPEAPIMLDSEPVPGAGRALRSPPQDLRVIDQALTRQHPQTMAYRFPLGWTIDGLVSARLVGDINHTLLTGFTDSGKDSWAAAALLYLAYKHRPDQLRIAIIDGKGGLSWLGWGDLPHVMLFAKQPQDIRSAMDALKRERERRTPILEAAQCEKWEEYTGPDMPLLVVFVSELMLLQDATSKTELADWLNTELTSARSMGIRYIVSTQTATRMDTRWRSQIGLYIAGYQPRDDADEPNTSFSTKDLIKFGTSDAGVTMGVPPSAIPVPPAGAGVFTAIQGRTVITMRSSFLPKEHRLAVLAGIAERHPKALQPRQPVAARSALNDADNPLLLALVTGAPIPIQDDGAKASYSVVESHKSTSEEVSPSESTSTPVRSNGDFVVLPLPDHVVPSDEQRRIIEGAATVKSRRQLSLALYNTDGGEKSRWVSRVCDALGLLPSQRAA